MVMLYVTMQNAFLQHISTLSNRTLGISAQQVTPSFANLTIYDMNQFIKVRIVRREALSGPFSQWPFLPFPPAPPALARRHCAVGPAGDCAAHSHTACEMCHVPRRAYRVLPSTQRTHYQPQTQTAARLLCNL